MTTVAIHQPNYLPWLAYFRKLISSDIFVFFDNVQMPGGKSFVSRVSINISGKQHWLSVPISSKGEGVLLKDSTISGHSWRSKHIRTLKLSYSYSKWSYIIDDYLVPVYSKDYVNIADFNISLIRAILNILEVNSVKLIRASEMEGVGAGAKSIYKILELLDADTYLTGNGKGTQKSIEINKLDLINVNLKYVSLENLKYSTVRHKFIPGLSIIDALLNSGPTVTRDLLLNCDGRN
jgi:hypothetical protein